MDSSTQETTTLDTRNNRIGVMLNILNQIMEDCEEMQIEWHMLTNTATNLWSLRNSKNAYYCGRKNIAQKPGMAADTSMGVPE